MHSIESFTREFRHAAENQIPAELLDARLREIRSHLASAAKERGEIEAVRQFGKPRQLANEMIRAYHGYERQSPAKLAQTVGFSLYLAIVLPNVCVVIPSGQIAGILFLKFLGELSLLAAFGAFWLRAFKIRRWIVLPTLAWCAGAVLSITLWRIVLANIFPRAFPNVAFSQDLAQHAVTLLLVTLPNFAAILFILNGLALVLSSINDRRKVQRA